MHLSVQCHKGAYLYYFWTFQPEERLNLGGDGSAGGFSFFLFIRSLIVWKSLRWSDRPTKKKEQGLGGGAPYLLAKRRWYWWTGGGD